LSNPEHIAKLNEGKARWKKWRDKYPETTPDLAHASLASADLQSVDLHDADLRSADLTGANLRKAWLHGANLGWANLHKANLKDASLSAANLSHANLSEANLRGAGLDSANLYWTDLRCSDLSRAFLGAANLSNSKLQGTNLVEAYLIGANLNQARLQSANLTRADLTGASLLGTNLEGANLTACRVHGVSAWNVSLQGAIQSNLEITAVNESSIQVDNLEIAQFVYLLLSNQKIRDVIDTIGKKAVLILGRFSKARKAILDAIREALRSYGYVPILFDFDKPGTRDIQETIVILAGLVRFIIADITDPKSIPQELATIVPALPSVPVQPLLQTGHVPWSMYEHIKRYPWFCQY
jgi:uncharacterized protein YjbI with pentapeptide repeats